MRSQIATVSSVCPSWFFTIVAGDIGGVPQPPPPTRRNGQLWLPPLHDLSLVAATFSPLFVGLIFHGVCIKRGWFRRMAVPLDRGARLRGQPIFGPNKTYRGVVAVALGAAAGYTLQGAFPSLQPPGLRSLSFPLLPFFGFVVGATSMLGELPNSLLKRQLGVDAGAPGGGWLAPAFYVLDQVDFLLGAWLVVWPWVSPSRSRVL
jgi:hypothetical protein